MLSKKVLSSREKTVPAFISSCIDYCDCIHSWHPFIFVSITANNQSLTTLPQILLLIAGYQHIAGSTLRLYCLLWKSLMGWHLLTLLINFILTPPLKSHPSGFSAVMYESQWSCSFKNHPSLLSGLSLSSVFLSQYLRVYLYAVSMNGLMMLCVVFPVLNVLMFTPSESPWS